MRDIAEEKIKVAPDVSSYADSEHLLLSIEITIPGAKKKDKVGEFEKEGKTTIVISDNKRVKGVIGVTDEIRKESKPLTRKRYFISIPEYSSIHFDVAILIPPPRILEKT